MHVIGTAGHIDHGKSTLIKALTGTDPDRLKEEKERGMTIDLGFAFLTLPSGRAVGIVDVPGHHRFIRNMLAGVGSVDLVVFVVAATESWMPQSQEHLEIVNLLGIERGVLVLTKVDLAESDWVEMVEEEVREKVRGTVLEAAPFIKVSATTGEGLDRVTAAIDEALVGAPAPSDLGRPRLWIDRVFTVKGAGTVVTGTLQGGAIRVEDELEVLPSTDRVRIRGLQSHKRQLQEAPVGGRVALNLAGVEVQDVHRGDALVAPGHLKASLRFNVHLRTVPSLERPILKESEMKVYVGTAERVAHIKLLDRDELGPGQDGLAQVEVEHPCAVAWHDRFVIRDPGHLITVGGGRVLMAGACRVRGQDHRYHRADYSESHRVLVGRRVPERLNLDLLRARIDAPLERLLNILLEEQGWIELKDLHHLVPASKDDVNTAFSAVIAEGDGVCLPSFAVSKSAWKQLQEKVRRLVGEFHQRYPLRSGAPRETLRSNLGMDWRLFDEVVAGFEGDGLIVSEGARLRLADHEVSLSEDQREQVDRLIGLLNEEPHTPPSLDGLIERHGFDEELIGALVEQRRLVRISKGVAFTRETFDQIQVKVVQHVEDQGGIDVGALRDLLNTTRKYAVPLLEYLDQIEVTRRVGDARVLGLKAKDEIQAL